MTGEQAEAVTRWRETLSGIAVDEMLHLTLVANLMTAIGAAGEGDIVLVKQGTYPQALGISGKSLTVQAEKGATVTVGQPNVSGPCSVTALTAAQNVRLRGLTLVVGLNVQNDQGTVWIEDCSITNGYSDLPALFAGSSASVVLIRTTAQGTGSNCTDGDYEAGSGLVLDGATVHAFGCTFKGGDGGTITKFIPPTTGCHAQQGGDGIRSLDVQDFLFLSDCTAKGGRGICTLHQSGVEHAMPGEGLNAAGTAEVFDSKLEGGPPGLESWQWFPDECTPPGDTSPSRCSALPSALTPSMAARSTGFCPSSPDSAARLMRTRSW